MKIAVIGLGFVGLALSSVLASRGITTIGIDSDRKKCSKIAKKNPDVSAILVCKKVKDAKRYGILQIKNRSSQVYFVEGVEEKPVRPKSNLGILALYYFKPEIFHSLKKTKRGRNNELQLTDGIQQMINDGKKVLAIPLAKDDVEIDVGTVESYRDAQTSSYKRA